MTSCSQPNCSQVEVIQRRRNEWDKKRVSLNTLKQTCNEARVNIFFGQADSIRECANCRQTVTSQFKIKPLFWTKTLRRANAYYGCVETFDVDDNVDGRNSWFRYLIKQVLPDRSGLNKKDYLWYKINVYTRWELDGSTNIFIFDLNESIRKRFREGILDTFEDEFISDPYWFHSIMAEEVIRLQDEAVWAIRNLVREMELVRTSRVAPNPDYPRLHDTARHATHVSETLDLTLRSLRDVKLQHEIYAQRHPTGDRTRERVLTQVSSSLRFCEHMVQSLKFRSESNSTRLANEINLAFQTVAQYDSSISVQIGKAAKSDSSSMKTISVLTLVFLPATFVSAIFGTQFFAFIPASGERSQSLQVSVWFWLYWAITLPLTLTIVLAWVFWDRLFPKRPATPSAVDMNDMELFKLASREACEDRDGRGDQGS